MVAFGFSAFKRYDGNMTNKKKRNKAYKGSGAAVTRPTITRVNAVDRNPVHQWWFDHQRVAKPVAIAAGIGVAIIICIIGLIDIIW